MIVKPYMLYILVYILNVDAWIGLSQKMEEKNEKRRFYVISINNSWVYDSCEDATRYPGSSQYP